MRTPASEHVTLVEVLELIQPFEEFAAAVQAAARRLEVEGIKELITLQFYADPASTEVTVLLLSSTLVTSSAASATAGTASSIPNSAEFMSPACAFSDREGPGLLCPGPKCWTGKSAPLFSPPTR
jgi:hypothetical protein